MLHNWTLEKLCGLRMVSIVEQAHSDYLLNCALFQSFLLTFDEDNLFMIWDSWKEKGFALTYMSHLFWKGLQCGSIAEVPRGRTWSWFIILLGAIKNYMIITMSFRAYSLQETLLVYFLGPDQMRILLNLAWFVFWWHFLQ